MDIKEEDQLTAEMTLGYEDAHPLPTEAAVEDLLRTGANRRTVSKEREFVHIMLDG